MDRDTEFPDIRDLLSIVDMVSNNVHYLEQLEGSKVPGGRWGTALPSKHSDVPTIAVAPGGVVAPAPRKSRKENITVAYDAIPPSVRRAYTKLRKNEIFSTAGPVYRVAPEYQSTALADGWRKCIETVTVATMATVAGIDTTVPLSIPLSTAEHENIQLEIGRRSRATGALLGECCQGKNCEALAFTGNTRPLHPYLTKSQEHEFQTKGTLFEGRCLLDIRKTITNVVHLHHRECLGVEAHNQLPMSVPFYNSVNAPGGYRIEHTIGPNPIMFMQAHVVAHNPGMLFFEPTEIDADGIQCGRFNQSRLIWGAPQEASSN